MPFRQQFPSLFSFGLKADKSKRASEAGRVILSKESRALAIKEYQDAEVAEEAKTVKETEAIKNAEKAEEPEAAEPSPNTAPSVDPPPPPKKVRFLLASPLPEANNSPFLEPAAGGLQSRTPEGKDLETLNEDAPSRTRIETTKPPMRLRDG
jgi:hypothetical protein